MTITLTIEKLFPDGPGDHDSAWLIKLRDHNAQHCIMLANADVTFAELGEVIAQQITRHFEREVTSANGGPSSEV